MTGYLCCEKGADLCSKLLIPVYDAHMLFCFYVRSTNYAALVTTQLILLASHMVVFFVFSFPVLPVFPTKYHISQFYSLPL